MYKLAIWTCVMTSTSDGDETRNPPPADPGGRTWRKAKMLNLTPQMSGEDALATIIAGCAEHLRGNEACVLSRDHEEGIHQMRVAVRRLRSCLSLHRPFIPNEQYDHLNGELKWLIGELGPARDLDVFVADILAPVVRQIENEPRLVVLAGHVEQRRDAAYARAQAAVCSQRYLGLVLLLGSWAEGRGWNDLSAGAPAPELQASAADIARSLLDGIHQQLLVTGAAFEDLDATQRHQVRIVLKKLRYASEFFSSLFAKRRAEPYIEAMKTLQDDLGASNDVAVASKLLKRVLKRSRGKERARLAYASGVVVGWHSHVGDDRERELIRAWTRFATRRPYWPASSAADEVRPGSATQHPEPLAAAAESEGAAVPPPSATEAAPGSEVAPAPAAPRRRSRVTRSARGREAAPR